MILEGTLLKPNMVLSGTTPQQASVDEVAEHTVRVFRSRCRLRCRASCSCPGGQSDEQATARLNAMNQRAAPVAAVLLVRPGAAGAGAQGVERRGREPRRRAGTRPARAPGSTARPLGDYKPEMESAGPPEPSWARRNERRAVASVDARSARSAAGCACSSA